MEFAQPGHILFGSDFPNAPTDAIVHFTRFIEEGMPGGVTVDVLKENALSLFPHLRQIEKEGSE